MEYRPLGRSGLKVSAVGLGCNNFGMRIDQAQTDVVVGKAIDVGITLFDTADMYGKGDAESERYLGKALGSRRQEIIIGTKFGNAMGKQWYMDAGMSRDRVIRAVEASLKRLNTDYIDLYQIHRPDTITPIEEVMRAMDDLVRQGKVRYIGHSNFTGWQTVDAAWTAKESHLTPFISAQNHYSILSRQIEAELVPACVKFGVGILPFFPLESGLLSGQYKRGEKPPEGSRGAAWASRGAMSERFFGDTMLAKAEALQNVCDEAGCTLLDLAFGWLLSKSYVPSVIAGATRPEQLDGNVKAGAYRPSADVLAKVDAISPPPKGP